MAKKPWTPMDDQTLDLADVTSVKVTQLDDPEDEDNHKKLALDFDEGVMELVLSKQDLKKLGTFLLKTAEKAA